MKTKLFFKRNKILNNIFLSLFCMIIYLNIYSQNFWSPNYDNSNGNSYSRFTINSSGALYAMSGDVALYRTNNEGSSWIRFDESKYSDWFDQSSLSPAVKGNKIFLASSIFVGSSGWGIKRTDDDGNSWAKKNNGLGADTNIERVFVMPNGNIIAYYHSVSLSKNKLYLSTNEGENWTMVKDLIYDELNNEMAVVSNAVYLFGNPSYISNDNGQTWSALSAQWDYTSDLFVSSNGDYFKSTYDTLVYKSTDQGITWTPTSNNGLLSSSGIVELLGTPGDTLYLATWSKGIFYSPDLGENWIAINSGAPASAKFDMILSKGGYLFLSASAAGIYRSSLPVTNAALSISDLAKNETKISLYPNLNNGKFTLKVRGNEGHGAMEIMIYNILGEIIYSAKHIAHETELSFSPIGMSNGIYFLKVQSDEDVWVKKVGVCR